MPHAAAGPGPASTVRGCGRELSPANRPNLVALDPYHLPLSDTLDRATYEGWKQVRLLCDRCHGDDAQGTAARLGLSPEKFDGLYRYPAERSSSQFFGGRPALRRR